MVSPVDVVNLALTEIGNQGLVTSISPSDGSIEGNAASLLYQPKIDALHRAAHWNFARRQLALTLLRATIIDGVTQTDIPPTPWLYEYLYPPDCLKARFIIPTIDNSAIEPPLTTATNVSGQFFWGFPVKYVVANDNDKSGNPTRVILTNQQNAILVYTGRIVNPDLWDPHFLSAATATLGAYFVNALGRNRELMKDQIEIAMNVINAARVTDGNEGLTAADHLPDWMRIRGYGPGLLDRDVWFSGWDLMAWPNGLVV